MSEKTLKFTAVDGNDFVISQEQPFIITQYSRFLFGQISKQLKLTGNDTVLDFGTGCGIQALTAVRCGAGRVYAADIYEKPLELTRKNAQLCGYGKNILTINVHDKNLESVIRKPFDYIISNPASLPVPNRLAKTLAKTFSAGEDGMDMINDLIGVASRHLSVDGTMLFINTSLVCLRRTLALLRASGFSAGIIAIKELAFRPFYSDFISHWEGLRSKGDSFWLMKNNKNYEILYLIKAKRVLHGK